MNLDIVEEHIKYLKEKTEHLKGVKINYHEKFVSQIEDGGYFHEKINLTSIVVISVLVCFFCLVISFIPLALISCITKTPGSN